MYLPGNDFSKLKITSECRFTACNIFWEATQLARKHTTCSIWRRTSYSGSGSLVILRMRRLRDVAARPPVRYGSNPWRLARTEVYRIYNLVLRTGRSGSGKHAISRHSWYQHADHQRYIWYLAHTGLAVCLPARGVTPLAVACGWCRPFSP